MEENVWRYAGTSQIHLKEHAQKYLQFFGMTPDVQVAVIGMPRFGIWDYDDKKISVFMCDDLKHNVNKFSSTFELAKHFEKTSKDYSIIHSNPDYNRQYQAGKKWAAIRRAISEIYQSEDIDSHYNFHAIGPLSTDHFVFLLFLEYRNIL